MCLAPSAPEISYCFGFSTQTGTSSRLASFYLFKLYQNQVIESQPITKEQFVNQAQGKTFSLANPARIDHFLVNGIQDRCSGMADRERELTFDCSIIDDIWRLRFREFPLASKHPPADQKGWATGEIQPSERQQDILFQYGIERMYEPFVGEEAWRLLRDMGDPSWVAHYRGAP